MHLFSEHVAFVKINIKLLFLTFYFSLAFGQSPDILWTKTYGGTSFDSGYDVRQTDDGGYIVAGVTLSFGAGGRDVYLIRTDSLGDTLWTKTYGGTDNDYGYSVQQTLDGGFIIAGLTSSFGAGNSDAYVLRIDEQGDTLWTRTYGGADADGAYSINVTADSCYIIAGITNSFGQPEVYLIKINSKGDTIWTRRYDGELDRAGLSVQQTFDGGYIVAGYTGPWNDEKAFFLKTDTNGDSIWVKLYEGQYDTQFFDGIQTPSGGYIAVGYTGGYWNHDIYLVKTDMNGDTLWTRTYDSSSHDRGFSIDVISWSGYIITGIYGECYLEPGDLYLLRIDVDGNPFWSKRIGGVEHDQGNAVRRTPEGGYVIAGETASFGSGSFDVYLIRTATDYSGIVEKEVIAVKKGDQSAIIITGPLLLPTDKKCKVYDISGRNIAPDKIRPGIYFIEIDGVVTHKVVKVR